MLVRPLPGVGRDDLLQELIRLQYQVGNASSAAIGSHTNEPLYAAYNTWADEAVRSLRGRISSEDVDRLVLTKRYWLLQSIEIYSYPVPGMLRTEIGEREAAFKDAVWSLGEQIKHWSRDAVFVVPDTSVCFNADKLEDWDVGAVLGTREAPVHLLFPMVVIDELDRLKEVKGDARWRASYTLAVLDRVLSLGTTIGVLRPKDFTALKVGGIPRGKVTVEIVLDPPGHVRLPIADDEIIDRALAIQSLAGREVIIITYDTGQSHRARMVGLKELKLSKPLGPEPERK